MRRNYPTNARNVSPSSFGFRRVSSPGGGPGGANPYHYHTACAFTCRRYWATATSRGLGGYLYHRRNDLASSTTRHDISTGTKSRTSGAVYQYAMTSP